MIIMIVEFLQETLFVKESRIASIPTCRLLVILFLQPLHPLETTSRTVRDWSQLGAVLQPILAVSLMVQLDYLKLLYTEVVHHCI